MVIYPFGLLDTSEESPVEGDELSSRGNCGELSSRVETEVMLLEVPWLETSEETPDGGVKVGSMDEGVSLDTSEETLWLDISENYLQEWRLRRHQMEEWK